MKFKELSLYFKKVEDTASRLEITRLLAELFKKLTAKEIDKTMYLLQGRVVPMFDPVEFGFAEKMVIRSAVSALSIDKDKFIGEYGKIGDIGKTVERFKKSSKRDLEIIEVFNELSRLANSGGKGSQEIKVTILSNLISQLDSLSCRYLVRIVLGVMRLGFSDMTVLDSLSWMIKNNKSLRPAIEGAYHVRPDLGFLAKFIKENNGKKLDRIQPNLFTPILMMKAERLSSAQDILKKIGECAVEPKYDGFRLQVHYKKNPPAGGEARLYSRNLEEVSRMYPDLIEAVKRQVSAKEIIFEGEAIGFDPYSGNFLPFQETVQRKRKYRIEEMAKQIPLKLFTFELLYLNGKSYINQAFSQRRKHLAKIIKSSGDEFKDIILVSQEEIIKDEKKLEIMFEEALSKGLEGVVAKKLTGVYQPGARGWNWIKFKRSYSAKVEDTIDCLVMGYDFGRGKRAGFGIGAFLVGVYDQKKDNFVTVAKIGTGLSDQEWKQLKVKSEKLKIEKKPALYNVDKQMYTDVWVKPALVVEIKADEITRSPVHTAGRVMKKSKSGSALDVDTPGFALRFPRLKHFRDDRRPEDATTLREVEKMFKAQGKK